MSGCPGYRDHDYDEDGFCVRCCNYDEGHDENPYDNDKVVTKTVSGVRLLLNEKWIDRAKELLREHKIASVNEAYRVVELLEAEMRLQPFDREVSNVVIVALRETEDERTPAKTEGEKQS